MRVLAAVVTGYVIFAISAALLFQFTGHDPHITPGLGFGIFSVLYGIFFAGLGGYIAERIVPGTRAFPGMWVGCIIAVGALASLVAESGKGSTWSEISALALMAPAACAGGFIGRRSHWPTSHPSSSREPSPRG